MENEILNELKLILGVKEDSDDELFKLYIKDISSAIINRCRISVLPKALYTLVAQICARVYRNNKNEGVRAITEGDRRIEFSQNSESVINEYKDRLKPFTNIMGVLPSEVCDGDI